MTTSNEVCWESLWYALIPIALNSMLQPREPTGTTCGFDSSLRIYLRSSPILCAVDATFILIRFIFYTRRRGHVYSLARAAKEIRYARGVVEERHQHQAGETIHEVPRLRPGYLLSPEANAYLLYFTIAFGVITQLPKLTVYSGGAGAIPWTKVWAWFYFGSWLVVEITFWLAWLEDDVNLDHRRIQTMERWIAPCEKMFGWLAILVQLAVLAAVDMKAIPPDPNIVSRWWFRGVRFLTHCAVLLVHPPFLKIAPKIDAAQPVPGHYIGLLLIFILVPHVVSASTQGNRFSSLYFMVSVMISYSSWTLYFFSWTKKWLLFCEHRGRIQRGNRGEVGNRRRVQIIVEPQHDGLVETRWQNVLAFDFFLRILFFSGYWYIIHYDPTGTAKPEWTDLLG